MSEGIPGAGSGSNRDLPLGAHHFFRAGEADALPERMLAALDAPAAYRIDLKKILGWDEIAAQTMALYDLVMVGRCPRAIRTA